ncbi:MAG: hypothetical protein H6R04_2039 [Burkholderiaceae bacterium]|nr:hypothetical protein [Burkholderiaceae bacterium]
MLTPIKQNSVTYAREWFKDIKQSRTRQGISVYRKLAMCQLLQAEFCAGSKEIFLRRERSIEDRMHGSNFLPHFRYGQSGEWPLRRLGQQQFGCDCNRRHDGDAVVALLQVSA